MSKVGNFFEGTCPMYADEKPSVPGSKSTGTQSSAKLV
jgi:hypothetical protein